MEMVHRKKCGIGYYLTSKFKPLFFFGSKFIAITFLLLHYRKLGLHLLPTQIFGPALRSLDYNCSLESKGHVEILFCPFLYKYLFKFYFKGCDIKEAGKTLNGFRQGAWIETTITLSRSL